MHPPLAQHKNQGCQELIRELETCHKHWGKFFGQCNDIKEKLNLCLRSERVDRTRNNRELAKEKRKQVEMKWKEIDDES